jgi:hypothetical protein
MPGYGKKNVNNKKVMKGGDNCHTGKHSKKVMKGAGRCGYSKQKGSGNCGGHKKVMKGGDNCHTGKHSKKVMKGSGNCGGHKKVMKGAGGCATNYKVNQKGSGNCGGHKKVMRGGTNAGNYLSTMTPEELQAKIELIKELEKKLQEIERQNDSNGLHDDGEVEIKRKQAQIAKLKAQKQAQKAELKAEIDIIKKELRGKGLALKTSNIKPDEKFHKGGFIRDHSPMRNVSGKRTCRS